MGAELFDFRGKLTAEGHCAVAAHARAHDIDKSEVVRDIVHAWALKQIHGATLLASCLRAKGIAGESQGTSGSGRELPWSDDE